MEAFMKRVRVLMKDKIEKEKATTKAKMSKFLKTKTDEEMSKQRSEKTRKIAACKKYSKKKRNAPK